MIIDTSIWSLALRRSNPDPSISARLGALIQSGDAYVLGCVRQEILSGVRDSKQFELLKNRLRSFPDLPLFQADYEVAAEFFNLCRSRGVQGSNTDFLICAVASRRKLSIYTADYDFVTFKEHIDIQVEFGQ